jgi:DNA-binding NtrC family response regulator
MFLLDAKRRLILFNDGCRDWTGWTADELLGQTCDYVTESDPQSRTAILAACAPPAEVWQGQPAEIPLFLPHQTAAPRAVRLRFQPLLDAEQRVTLVLGQILSADEPVTSIMPTPAQTLHVELAALRHQVRSRYGEESVIAGSTPMRRVLTQLAVARQGTGCVLFAGERGAGREHLARVVHARSALGSRAFVPVDCRRTDSSDLKRMLKHLKNDQHEVETLRTGTLFLAEISAAPRDVQDRLADWLGARPADDSPRIMAATDQSLEELIDRDQFHRELYYLLTPLVIEVPPLRQRAEDVLPLAQFFLEAGNRAADKQLSGFSPAAADALCRYPWPGNVAELQDVVRSAAAQASGPQITPENFPLSFRAGQDAQRLGPPPASQMLPLDVVLEHVEREQIQAALTACRNNLSRVAEMLGLSRPKLYRRLEALGLMPDDDARE